MEEKKNTCLANGCKDIEHVKGYYKKHYKQVFRHGHVLERTRFDKNEIIINNELNYAEILLYDIHNIVKNKTILIDIEDVEKVKDMKWSLDSKGYPVTTINRIEKIRMHRMLLNSDVEVDHENKNRRDNRKFNLRVASSSDNGANKSMQRNNTSGFTGVFWYKNTNKWQVNIQYYKEEFQLGYYKSKNIAISVRLKGEQLIFKEFAPNIDKFHMIDENINKAETINELKHFAQMLDNCISIPKVKRLTQYKVDNLYNDTMGVGIEYNRKELATKYKCSLSTIDVHIRKFKQNKEMS